MTIKARALVLLILLNTALFGQNQIGQFRNFNINDGLSQTSVGQIFQDKKGFLWFTTSDGLNKFDGYKFTVYKYNPSNLNSLSENSIYSILLEDSDDNLWIFTGDFVINTFNLRTQEFHRYLSNLGDTCCIKPFKAANFGYEDRKKNIWISTSSGLNRFDKKNKRFIRYPSIADHPSTLPDEVVRNLFEDSFGILWFITKKGLCRYNNSTGKMVRYPSIPEDKSSISSNITIKILEDKSKNLWILANNGLNLYNRTTNNFTRFKFPGNLSMEVVKYDQYPMVISPYNCIWIGTMDGLLLFDIKMKSFSRFVSKESDPTTLSNNHITKIYHDSKNNTWVGTMNGLNLYNAHNNNFSRISSVREGPTSNNISDIIQDKTGDLWVLKNVQNNVGGTLNKWNGKNGKLEMFPSEGSVDGVSNIRVFMPVTDRTGNLWFGSFGEGVFKYSPIRKNFELFKYDKLDRKSLGGNSVWGLAEDQDKNIWVALYGDGFDKFDVKTKQFEHFTHDRIKSKIPEYTVMSITCGLYNDLWISTLGAGLFHYDIKKDQFKQYLYTKNEPNSVSSNHIFCTIVDHTGKIWIATSGGGIDIFNPATNQFQYLKSNVNNPNGLSSNDVWYILEDKNKEFWISCPSSIDRYNPVTQKFIHYKSKSTDSTGLLAGKALCIYEDLKGNIWFGTSTIGLSMFNRNSGKFQNWTESDGLPNNVIYGILEDEDERLWLSTNRGLSRFDLKKNKFTNYDISFGLQSNEFTQFSFLKGSDQTLYFGGVNGFNAFHPSDIKRDTAVPYTAITGFQVFNKEVPVLSPDQAKIIRKHDPNRILSDKSGRYLPMNISYARELKLTYREKVFTIEFAALQYDHTEKIRYRYRMDNFDPDWNYSENRRFATYTNLPAGEYVFKVSAANIDGTWNPHPAELKITILPPFWLTYWFVSLEILFIVGIVILVVRMRERELKVSKARLEKKVQLRTHEIEVKNEELELRNLQIIKQKEEIEFQTQQLKVELSAQNQTSELALLRSQINPHFLFNTLNNIYSLVYQKTESAPEAVMKLSEIMRYMLYDASADKVLLEKEIEYLKSFIELQILRIRQKDFVEFNITGDYSGLMISPMLLIPFVENAFKHGVKKWVNPGIIINLNVVNRKINFDVTNFNKKNEPINKDETGGIGLPNIKRRLDLLYCGRYILEINKTDDLFRVKLELDEK